MYFYSPSTKAFYSTDVNAENIPVDAVGVSSWDYRILVAGRSEGKDIAVDGTQLTLQDKTYTPEEAKAIVWEKIKVKRDALSDEGYKVGTHWFHSDSKSRIQQLGLVIMGTGIPANLQWKTMTGEFVTMTQTLANQVFGAAAAQEQAIFAKAEAHRAAMEASADPLSYDFSAGWPETFSTRVI